METARIGKYLLRFLLALALLLGVTVLALLGYRELLQHRVLEQTKITAPPGIDSLEKVMLGGLKQWILIRGTDTGNPALLHLHGGPGAADISIARHFDTELVKHFVVVHWDQRGAGKSYRADIPPEVMNREQFISDIRELTELLLRRFDKQNIYLVGHSWGSEIGIIAAHRWPELFHAFVGVGQVVEYDEAERISYEFALDKATQTGNQEAIRELREIAPPYRSRDELLIQRKWLEHFGGQSHSDLHFQDLLKIGLTSPDYSLLDGLKFFRGADFSTANLWQEGKRTDLFRQVPRIDVPVYFFVGRYDYNTPGELVRRFYESLEAPEGKRLIEFPNSGHMIPYESPEEYADALIKILNETYEAGSEL